MRKWERSPDLSHLNLRQSLACRIGDKLKFVGQLFDGAERLRQGFHVNENLEAACLLNTEQEPNVDGGAIRKRRRQRYRPG